MHNPSPIKKLGQHFLKNKKYVDKEVEEAAIKPEAELKKKGKKRTFN